MNLFLLELYSVKVNPFQENRLFGFHLRIEALQCALSIRF